MTEFAISVNNLSKKYRLFGSNFHRLKESLHPFNKKYHEEFWALRNITFDIKKGQTVGIIGMNGSGKSTLLQIISGILTPTTGSINVNGRISALLELGTGFNPQFTGRENVYLNATINGFSRKEIDNKFPSIAKFADIGEFIDQPVKIYSSGMFVRLAFAVAINIDPDILIIDEALSVGDAKFQHKCFQKLHEFQDAGKTILFVSHSTDAVIRHCDCAILLQKGEIIEVGEPKIITNYYMDLLFTGKITNYQVSPVLVEEAYKGFNIVHFKTKYYAVLQSLGFIDFLHLDDNYLTFLITEKKCVVSMSFEETKHLVDQFNPQEDFFSPHITNKTTIQIESSELDKFLTTSTEIDNCINRRSYNKNEYRFGNLRAEIIDYLIISNELYDPVIVTSGDLIDLYLKVKFNDYIELPMVGFSIKTIDGITVYGSNTRFSKHPIKFANAAETAVFRFVIKLSLIPGEFFIELGVAEMLVSEDEPFDIRKNVIHLSISEKNVFEGLAELGSTFEEISRKKIE